MHGFNCLHEFANQSDSKEITQARVMWFGGRLPLDTLVSCEWKAGSCEQKINKLNNKKITKCQFNIFLNNHNRTFR